MNMDMSDLMQAHSAASQQVVVLETCLNDLQTRRSSIPADTEHDYLQFKIDVIKGVLHQYTEYRDDKWTQLQHESAIFLHSILQPRNQGHSNHDDTMTPPDSPTSSEQTSLLWTPEVDGEPIDIHQLPPPLTPIRDEHMMLTPPSSPRSDRHTSMHYYSRNLSSLFDEHSRDM